MAIVEQNVLLSQKDASGNRNLLYPVTKLECVDGSETLLDFGQAQTLTDAQKAQARANIGAAEAGASATAITADQISALFAT